MSMLGDKIVYLARVELKFHVDRVVVRIPQSGKQVSAVKPSWLTMAENDGGFE